MFSGYTVGMKTHDTIAGSYYGITSPNGCTVTDEYGALNKTIEAGDQLTLQAPGAQLIVDDDEAIVRKSTFNRAAAVLRLLGGGVKIDWDKYAECVKEADLQAVNADYKNDLTVKGEWKWSLPKLKSGYKAFENADVRAFYSDLPVLDVGSHMFNGSKIVIFKGDLSKVTNGWNMFNNTPLEVFESALSKLVEGLSFFGGCKLNKQSALNALESILSATNSVMRLTIGIHVDNKNDEDIAAAVATAEEAGWRITVQWNGTPTASAASTFALRRRPVWAKLAAAPDGNTVLDWGHYVTNAEDNGYTEFASLEEAKEHFNITDV